MLYAFGRGKFGRVKVPKEKKKQVDTEVVLIQTSTKRKVIMPTRPLINLRVKQLEALYEKCVWDREQLSILREESSHRKRPKAVELLKMVSVRLSATSRSNTVVGRNDLAPEQRTVVELEDDAQFLVEAGPGTGKTAVACARVAYLIE